MKATISRKKILVTGATGFIGSNLVRELVKKGAIVTVLIRKKKDSSKFKDVKVKIAVGDLTNYKSLEKAISRVDLIYNLAGSLPYHKLPDTSYWDANVKGVKYLMALAEKNNVKKVVHVSTVGIYGNNVNGVSELSKPNPTDVYSKSKLAGEKEIFKFKKSKVAAVIIRPTITYGPYDLRPGFLNLFRFIKKGLFIPIGNGENYFHTLYVGNLVDALILAGIKDNINGEDFIIGDDPCPRTGRIWGLMAKLTKKNLPVFYLPKYLAFFIGFSFDVLSFFGIPTPLGVRRVNFLTEQKRYKITKARKMLGYRPKIDLASGLTKTFVWYNNQKLI